jgi:hypothetical protein
MDRRMVALEDQQAIGDLARGSCTVWDLKQEESLRALCAADVVVKLGLTPRQGSCSNMTVMPTLNSCPQRLQAY